MLTNRQSLIVLALIAMVAAGIMLGHPGLLQTTTVGAQAQEAQKQGPAGETKEERQRLANALVGNLRYVKDPRTQTCFAFYLSRGGSWSLTMVPEEKIPKGLLVVAEVK